VSTLRAVVAPWYGRTNAVAIAGLTAVAAYFAVISHAVNNWRYEHWMLLILVPALFALGAGIISWVTRNDAEPLRGLIVLALAVKLAAGFVRYFVAFDLYEGLSDAGRYHEVGTEIANSFHRGEITVRELLAFERSTAFITDLTGAIYSIVGSSRIGGFVVYAWIGFWGLFLFHRAALVGLPEGSQRRYALLVFFLPSLVFWPSSVGKEAVMVLSLGLCALGVARLGERNRRAWLPLAAGIGISYMLRPHVTVVVLGALVVAIALRRRRGRTPLFGPTGRILTVLVLIAGLAFVFGRTVDEFLPQEESISATEAAGELLDRAESGTASGGSEIERLTPSSPLEYPYTAFSVLLRPTLIEARDAANVVAAIETTFVLGLLIASRKRLKQAFTLAFRRPYVMFCIVYTGIFVFAWSAFANLGALARQRVQVWPFFLLLLAIPERQDQPARPAPRQAFSRIPR
jgi:hypothetical protein